MEQVAVGNSLGLRGRAEIPIPVTPRSSRSVVGDVALVSYEPPPIPAPLKPPLPPTPKSNATVAQGSQACSGMPCHLVGNIAEQDSWKLELVK